MTTLAFDGTTLAADTASSSSGSYMEQVKKIRKHPSGYLIGGCGDTDIMNWFLDNFAPEIVANRQKGHRLAPPSMQALDFSGMIVSPSGKVYTISDKFLVVPIKTFGYAAMGSGEQFAMGALAAGATAREAVKIAMKHDGLTSGTVMAVSLQGKKKK